MKRLFHCILLVVLCGRAAWAQDPVPIVESVEISGISEERLSPTLREFLNKLAGEPYNAQTAAEYADRIQRELPEYVAAARTLPGAEPDRVRLIFVVARQGERPAAPRPNINARYVVETVELEGIAASEISSALYDDMQKMKGQPLGDRGDAENLRDRLAAELEPGYRVEMRIERGGNQQIRVIYEVHRLPMLPFRTQDPFFVYHSKQGFSIGGVVNVAPSPPDWLRLNVGLATSADELIERYAGFQVGLETVQLGTDRLGLKLDYSAYRAQWKPLTLNAAGAPGTPDIYRLRHTFEPSLAFALSREIYVTAGISLTELELQFPSIHDQTANAATGSFHYGASAERGDAEHHGAVRYILRAGTDALDSDFIYTRHRWDGRYVYEQDDNRISLSVSAGRIAGDAPLFERFALGNSQTLRGWSKYDVWPLGGSRMAYASLEYGHDNFHVFYDAGSVWDRDDPVKVRHSLGIGLGASEPKDCGDFEPHCLDLDAPFSWVFTLGVPLRSSGPGPTFSLGFHF